ncbi:unnamed protein product [Brassicogethes aeneus]|uniref:Mediator of RNA polymerase II transcription subunit 24 n=1 Tax=Brassicogethes aeneus TaxID=1431903 RepID=A0A9P0FB25_BRAAE|nr:unnamed protein product [Brassicogethes aeneus]
MVMESKTTSKTSCLKNLLLRAWRERWTDLQWGINIKTVLPRGVSGDVYNLADCILQQAVVGAGANQLVLSYLQHSLSSQLVSHAAVLQRLSKYNQLSKVHCVYSLLEFLEGMLPGVTCCGKPEETVLATAVMSTALWLVNILQQCKTSPQLLLKASSLLQTLMTDDFYVSMMCLARYNDPELFTETSRHCAELLSTDNVTEDTFKYVRKLESIDTNMLCLPVESEKWPGSLIQYWLIVKLIGNPCASTAVLVEQLRLFQILKGYNNTRLYAELIRGSLLSLYNVTKTPQEGQWGAVAYLKVPYILMELAGKTDGSSVVNAVEVMLQHSPLLDAMDAIFLLSSLKCFLEELIKARLITEPQIRHILEKRDNTMATEGNKGIPNVIKCAESSLNGILKTFSTDYQKNQDALLGMLHQVLTGKSLELILAVATVQGQITHLVNQLIIFNKRSVKVNDEKRKALLFDNTFIILVSILQKYGLSVLSKSAGDSLFEQWFHNCMVEKQRPKAPEQLLRLGDPAVIDALLQQFNGGDVNFTCSMQDILFNIGGVMHEVLVAWEQGALDTSEVKKILDAVRGKMCCLPVAAAAWLCAYIRTAPQDTLLKPMNMVQQLLAPPMVEEECFQDRWLLACDIIRKMQRDVQLALQTRSNHQLVSKQPATDQLHQVWLYGIQRGWLDSDSGRTVHCLLETAGARWLVSAVIQELLKLRYKDQLQRGVDLALAIFHVDIVSCTLQLLSHVLPQLLYNDLQADSLKKPQLPSLACLTSYCVYTAWGSVLEEKDEPVPKMQRLNDSEDAHHLQDQLISSLRQLLNMFEHGIQEGSITQQTYFAFYLIKALVEHKTNSAEMVLAAIPTALTSDLLKTLPELFSYSLLLHLHSVYNAPGRINMAKDLCVLRNHYLRNIPNPNTNTYNIIL